MNELDAFIGFQIQQIFVKRNYNVGVSFYGALEDFIVIWISDNVELLRRMDNGRDIRNLPDCRHGASTFKVKPVF